MWDVDASGNAVVPPGATSTPVPNPLAAMQQQSLMTALLQQQAAITRRARRLHVGNLPPGLTGEALKELFNTTMQARAARSRPYQLVHILTPTIRPFSERAFSGGQACPRRAALRQ